jgi:thiol-disulfide isomerase/thioredoxin
MVPVAKVMMFTTPNCEPCHAIKPSIEELQEDYKQFEWVHIDTTADPDATAFRMGVRLVPTMVVLKTDGTEFGRHEGSSLIGYFNLLRRAKALLVG